MWRDEDLGRRRELVDDRLYALIFQYSESDLGGYPITPLSAVRNFDDGPKAGFDGATIRGFGMRAQVDW